MGLRRVGLRFSGDLTKTWLPDQLISSPLSLISQWELRFKPDTQRQFRFEAIEHSLINSLFR